MKEKVTSHIVVNTRTLLFFDICRKNKYLTISVCPQILVNRITQERCALQTLDLICRSAVRRTGHTELSFQKKSLEKIQLFQLLNGLNWWWLQYMNFSALFGKVSFYPSGSINMININSRNISFLRKKKNHEKNLSPQNRYEYWMAISDKFFEAFFGRNDLSSFSMKRKPILNSLKKIFHFQKNY